MLRERPKLGEILLKKSLVNKEQLKEALEVQQREHKPIGEILTELKMVTEKDIVVALGEQLRIPYAFQDGSLSKLTPMADQGLEKLISETFAKRYYVLPLSRHLNSLTIACVDPLDLLMMDNLKKLTGCEINFVLTLKADLQKAIDNFYGGRYFLRKAISASYEEEVEQKTEPAGQLSLDELVAKAEEAPVVRLVDLILEQAIEERASDIHIE
ncbi:MAG: hypothetical protein U9R31_03285, partial [Candidatus Omnitrophota bacterium]|nr:hypothetical protein [Candidatus Omnitrophota bacterium]